MLACSYMKDKKTQCLVVRGWKSLHSVDPSTTQYYVKGGRLVYQCEQKEHCNWPYCDEQHDLAK